MPICRYFQQGTCTFGDRCKFDHVSTSSHSYDDYTNDEGINYRKNYKHGNDKYSSGGKYSPGGKHKSVGKYSPGAKYSPVGKFSPGGKYSPGGKFSPGGKYSPVGKFSPGSKYKSGGDNNSNEREGISILRAKAQTCRKSLFDKPTSTASSNLSGAFSSDDTDSKPTPLHQEEGILQKLRHEFTRWEHSGLWPFSCFSPFKGQGSFPGLIDYSPEEIRCFTYQSCGMDKFEECQQVIKSIYDQAKLVRSQLITPNAEVFEILRKLSKGEILELPVASLSLEKQIPTSSIFGCLSEGNVQPVASSSTYSSSHKESPATDNQNFPALQAPKGGVFENTCPNPIFSSTSTSNTTSGMFGGAGRLSQSALIVNVSSTGNGSLCASSNKPVISDSDKHFPLEEEDEEMIEAIEEEEESEEMLNVLV